MALEIKRGDRYGNLTILKEGFKLRLPSGQTNRTADCKCDCGAITNVRLVHLTRLRTVSCGCFKKNNSNGYGKTKLYRVWRGMQERCDPNGKQKMWYYDKGVRVCVQWKNDFISFRTWALKNGYKQGLQIDREDNSKGYHPDNCRWVTSKINGNNKDNTFYIMYKSEKKAFCLLIEEKGLELYSSTIRTRIKRGWDTEKAIDTPIKKGNYVRVNF